MSVRLEKHDTCLIVHNTNAKRGAITPKLYEVLGEAVEQSKSPEIRSLIVTGGDFFCAGGDLSVLATRAALSSAERRAKVEVLHDVIRTMAECPVPIIAAIEGGAAGAGLALVLACDLVVAAEEAQFTAAYVKAGLTPDGGLTHSLSRLLPRQLAMQMCLLGKPISAEQLASHGGVTQLCPKGAALSCALSLAGELAAGPAQAQSRIRMLLASASDRPLADQLDREAAFMVEAQSGLEAGEGIRAFLEKRKAEFST